MQIYLDPKSNNNPMKMKKNHPGKIFRAWVHETLGEQCLLNNFLWRTFDKDMLYLISLKPLLLKNIAYLGSLKHFVFVFVCVIVIPR